MRVLVTAATRYGSTAEIGEAIAEALVDHGVDAEFVVIERAPSADGYDAAVLGSGVYAGHWLKAAKDYVARNEAALAGMPVWLFSSGPVGDPPAPDDDPVEMTDLAARTAAREHQLFAGKLDRSRLRFTDRAIVSALRAPEGDFRDWDAISAWAQHVAGSLREGARA